MGPTYKIEITITINIDPRLKIAGLQNENVKY
jgi:hypothetical protein